MVELDPNEAPLHRPKRVYAKLIDSFRYKDAGGQVRKFRDFIRHLAASTTTLTKHPFLKEPIRTARSAEDDEDLWVWIEGKESWMLPRLHDESTSANIYCNILSGLSWGATEIGLQGLLLLFDEAETLDVGATSYQMLRGKNFLRGLTLVCKSAAELWEDVEYSGYDRYDDYGYYTTTSGSYWGKKSGLQYSGRYSGIRFIWRSPSHLKVVFGFTPNDQVDNGIIARARAVLRDAGLDPETLGLGKTKTKSKGKDVVFPEDEERLEVESLSDRVLEQVFHQISRVYRDAHRYHASDTVRQRVMKYLTDGVGHHNTRMFIKTAIEALDIQRLASIGRTEPLQDG